MHPPLTMRGCNVVIIFFICVLTDCWRGINFYDCAFQTKPQGVADAAELLLVGLPFVDGGHGVLTRGSGAVAGSELVNESSLGIRVGGTSSLRWLLSREPSRLPEREQQGG